MKRVFVRFKDDTHEILMTNESVACLLDLLNEDAFILFRLEDGTPCIVSSSSIKGITFLREEIRI